MAGWGFEAWTVESGDRELWIIRDALIAFTPEEVDRELYYMMLDAVNGEYINREGEEE